MPAAELGRLRVQINGIISQFHDPAGFRIGMRDLLEQYSNRAYRAGQAAPPQPLLPSYRVMPLILRELEMQLSKACQQQPDPALDIIEILWQDTYLEPRLLATTLLGVIPASHSAGVLQKLRAWAQPNENFRILEALFQNGTVELRRCCPEQLLQVIEEWLNSNRIETEAMGVRAFIPLIEEPSFQNLPPVFRQLGPLVQMVPAKLQPDLLAVLQALIRRAPTETAYFLRQTLSMSAGANTARLVRRCLPFFGPDQQASLRAALQAENRQ